MTQLPAFREALRSAAHDYYGPRRKVRRRRVAVASALGTVCATAGVVALLLLVVQTPGDQENTSIAKAGVAPVSAAELEQSRALAAAPAVNQTEADPNHLIPHAELAAVASTFAEQTPYPPGQRDDFDWNATESDPSQSVLTSPATVQMLVEQRAACAWMRYWISADTAGDAASRRAAVQILADVALWPTNKPRPGSQTRWQEVAEQARAGQSQFVSERIQQDCGG